jgi:hypothetical protein
MTIQAINHLPLFGRSLRRECKPIGGTANPHGAITCPLCRAMLEAKVSAHSAESSRCKSGGQEARFFAADAANWQAVLDRKVA